MLRKNVAGQFLYFAGINATTGAALTGATFSVRRAIDGTFAAGGATITEDTGLGLYKAALTQADTNGNDLAFFFTATNAIPVCINALTTSADPSTDTSQTGDCYARLGAAGAGLTALASAADLATVAGYLDTEIAAIKAKTDNLPAAPASTTNITAASGVTLAATTGLGNQTANITGNLSGSVGSVTAAVAITSNIKQNQALAGFTFLMTDSTNHAPSTGLTVTVARSIDGGAFGAGALSAVTEVANGIYKVDFGAADLNGKVIILKATAAASDTTFERIVTQV